MTRFEQLCTGRLAAAAVTVGLLLAATGEAAARADPILFEVCYDGIGSDADDVFTEIYGTAGTSLNGWSLQGVNGADGTVYRSVSLTGATIPMDGLLVIATSSAVGSVLAARDFTADVDWQNGPDAVWLVDPTGAVIDALQYGNAGIYNAGEGSVAQDVAAGYSLSRDMWGTDTDDNASDFLALASPTPGTGLAVSPVPEPASLALVGLGGAAIGLTRRRRRGRSAT